MKFSKETMKGAAEVIVLQMLARYGEMYGYELIKAIAKTSEDVFEFQEGTLYPLLYRLERKKWVQSERKDAPSGKSRRYYAITAAGQKTLAKRATEYAAFAKGMEAVMHPASA